MPGPVQTVGANVDWPAWYRQRQACRVNLLHLCHILNYTKVSWDIHYPLLTNQQRFKGGTDTSNAKPSLKNLVTDYTPALDMWDLEGPRRRMNLMFRGGLKTTICTIAHKIQWIINYPNVRIRYNSASGTRVKEFLQETKNHFTSNAMFRSLFPEFVPWGKEISQFGNQEAFTVPCRTSFSREPTIGITSQESKAAGIHCDVMNTDDFVEKENSLTPEQIITTKSDFALLSYLIQTNDKPPHYGGWHDVAGTIYDFSDLHYSIWQEQEKLPEDKRTWAIEVISAAPDWPEGPSWWPSEFPMEKLREKAADPIEGGTNFYAQMLQQPRPSESGLVDSRDQIAWIPKKVMDDLYARLRLHVTIDVHGMENPSNKTSDLDYTCINLSGFSRDGTCYVLEVYYGRFTPFEVIDRIFDLWKRHPRIFDMKVEKDAHVRVLLPFLKREMAKRQIFPPVVAFPRDNTTSKKQRQRGLQPWFRAGIIRFSDGIAPLTRQHIEDEILKFPKYIHDDFIDTAADQMQNRDGDGVTSDVVPTAKIPDPPGSPPRYTFIGFDPTTHAEQWGFNMASETEPSKVDKMTGY